MLKLKNIVFFFLITFILCSCEKVEKPVILPPKPLDSVALVQVNLGEEYENQVYINFLEQNFIRSSVKNTAWDLSFDCTPESSRIYMNGGKGVFIGVLGRGDFLKNVNTNNVKWKWDAASGGDSIVLKNWCNPGSRHGYDSVYIIDRGPEAEETKRYFQFKIEYGNFGTFIVDAADLNGKKIFTAFINKDPFKNSVFLDFEKPEALNFEPKLNDWQFCFLRCRWVYYEFNPPLIYEVTGIHINTRLVSVAVDSSLKFDDIKKQDIYPMTFSNKRDVIGFDWKVYDFNQGRYITRKYVNYIIRTKIPGPGPGETKYYKLRFTDFYNKQGVKGSPKFEVAEIK